MLQIPTKKGVLNKKRHNVHRSWDAFPFVGSLVLEARCVGLLF